jgi:hypothetical protein
MGALTSSAEMGDVVIFVDTFIKGIYVHMPGKDYVSSIYNVAAIVWLQYVISVTLFAHDNRFVLLH